MQKSSYEKPILTIDITYLSLGETGIQIMLNKRIEPPFEDTWTLPGGFIHCDADRDIDQSANRIIKDKAKIEPDYLEQIETVGNGKRDPRGWSATVLFVALVNQEKAQNLEHSNTWMAISKLNRLTFGFDHRLLVDKVMDRFIAKSRYTSLPLYLLPPVFTLTSAQICFEQSIGSELEKKAFRRRLLSADIIMETGDTTISGKRTAALFKLKEKRSLYFFPRTIG